MKIDKLCPSEEEMVSSSSTSSMAKKRSILMLAKKEEKVFQQETNGHASRKVSAENGADNSNHSQEINTTTTTTRTDFRHRADSSGSLKDFRKTSFSYLNLLNDDGSFPHRTQPIGDPQTSSRRGSLTDNVRSKAASLEYINHTKKKDLMVRSNPIGLAEPSNKRDGYAVGRDGSFYRSSEHIYADSVKGKRSFSATPDREITYMARRASTSSLYSSSSSSSSVGFRNGSGLIATGKPTNKANMFMPFGGTINATPNWKAQKKEARSKSREDLTASNFIQRGIQEIESLTKAATSGESLQTATTTLTTTTTKQSYSSISSATQRESDSSKLSETNKKAIAKKSKKKTANLGSSFQAVDVMLKSNLQQEEKPIEVTVRRGGRSRSLSRHTVLPEQNVTISLPASRRTSRNASVDREAANLVRQRLQASSSVEIFNGTYEMKVPHPKAKRKMSAEITEIKTEFVTLESKDESSSSSLLTAGEERKDSDDARIEVTQDDTKTEDDPTTAKKIDVTVPKMETVVQGHTFNISNGLRKSSRTTSRENLSRRSRQTSGDQKKMDVNANQHGVGNALKGLDAALENLQHQQKQQKSKLINKGKRSRDSSTTRGDTATSVTVSLQSSRRSSRAASPSSQTSGFRSRKNSMDLYTADINMKVKGKDIKMVEKSTCHIRCDDDTVSDLKLCCRCHSPGHKTNACTEFGDLVCPRCLEWDHWEDTCPMASSTCAVCCTEGHSEKIHAVSDFKQRRTVVDTLGWEKLREWFYDNAFRSWWQLNGCVGVPLYKIYKRNTEWRKEVAPLTEDESNNNDIYNYKPERPARKNYKLEKDDSIDELMKSIKAPRKVAKEEDNEGDSGRSTPEHLKKYSGTNDEKEGDEEKENNNGEENSNKKRGRTFSETLKLLDDDIVAELNVN